MRQLHRPETIYSMRHVPSWMLLAAAAGMVNATAFLSTERFVTHVTGTATQLGMTVATLWLAVDLAIVLVSFVLGAMAASFVIDVRAHRGKPPLYALPLFVAAAIVGTVALLGRLGWFGPFGGSVDEPFDFGLLSALSFAMGLQNGGVATSTGLVVRTTHLTGPATDLGLNLAELFFARGERRTAVRRSVVLRAGKIAAFILGAGVAVPLARSLDYATLLVAAAGIVLANLLSFLDVRLPSRPANAAAPGPSTRRTGGELSPPSPSRSAGGLDHGTRTARGSHP